MQANKDHFERANYGDMLDTEKAFQNSLRQTCQNMTLIFPFSSFLKGPINITDI